MSGVLHFTDEETVTGKLSVLLSKGSYFSKMELGFKPGQSDTGSLLLHNMGHLFMSKGGYSIQHYLKLT